MTPGSFRWGGAPVVVNPVVDDFPPVLQPWRDRRLLARYFTLIHAPPVNEHLPVHGEAMPQLAHAGQMLQPGVCNEHRIRIGRYAQRRRSTTGTGSEHVPHLFGPVGGSVVTESAQPVDGS